MPTYEEETKSIEVAKATGRTGYFKVLERLFDMRRVQKIVITAGKVTYLRHRYPNEPEQEVEVDLETLMPYAIIRSREVTEILPASDNAAIVISQIFSQVHMDGLNPVAFASGHDLTFRQWHAHTTKVMLPSDESYGLPFLTDLQLPTESLFLCAAYGRRAALVDIVRSYKVTMPWRLK